MEQVTDLHLPRPHCSLQSCSPDESSAAKKEKKKKNAHYVGNIMLPINYYYCIVFCFFFFLFLMKLADFSKRTFVPTGYLPSE